MDREGVNAATLARYRKAILAAITTIVTVASALLTQNLLHGRAKDIATIVVAIGGVLLIPGAVAIVPNDPKPSDPLLLGLARRIGDIEQLLAAKHDQALAQNIVQTYATVAAKAKPKRDIGGRFAK